MPAHHDPDELPPELLPQLGGRTPHHGGAPNRYEILPPGDASAPPPARAQVPARLPAVPAQHVPPPPPPRGRHRQRRGRGWLLVGGILVVLVLIAGGTVLAGQRLTGHHTAAAHCSKVTTTLRVSASPDIAPVIASAAKDLDSVRGGCADVQVDSAAPAAVYQQLAAGSKGSAPAADVWVPDSTAWLAFAQASGGKKFTSTGPSLARTPIVIAASTSVADSLHGHTRWTDFANRLAAHQGPAFSMPSALSDTAGLLSVTAVRVAMSAANRDPGIAQMKVLTFRSDLTSASADTTALFDKIAAGGSTAAKAGVFTTTEQRVWAYQQDHPGANIKAIYPSDGMVEADYPMATTTSLHGATKKLADDLAARFHDPSMSDELAAQGLRGAQGDTKLPDVAPDAKAVSDHYARPTIPKAIDGAQSVAAWAQYHTVPFQVLVLVDGSASMNEKVKDSTGRTMTKTQLVRQAGVQAATLFGTETSLGLWEFNTAHKGSPYTRILPYGPIDSKLGPGTRRQALTAAVSQFSAPANSGTPLFETVLRGSAEMRAKFRRDAYTMVVVISDGKDEDSSYSMSTAKFLSTLKRQSDPKRPVPVYAVGYGKDADMNAMTAIAKNTGGKAINSINAGDLAGAIAQIFLAAHQVHR